MTKSFSSVKHNLNRVIAIRTIDETDLEFLRQWKNRFRDRFFFSEMIAEDLQASWYRAYVERENDFMFIVTVDGTRSGCIGFRKLAGRIDLYNIIRGAVDNSGDGSMTLALDLICHEARSHCPGMPVMASVLKSNPALAWYKRRGFAVVKEHPDFVELEQDPDLGARN